MGDLLHHRPFHRVCPGAGAAPGRAAGGRGQGRRPAPARLADARAELCHQHPAQHPLFDFDDLRVPPVAADRRHDGGHQRHHRAFGGGGLPLCGPPGGDQPAGTGRRRHRGRPEHGRHPPADHHQGDDPRKPAQPCLQHDHRPDHHPGLFGHVGRHRRRRPGQGGHLLRLLPLPGRHHAGGRGAADRAGAAVPDHRHRHRHPQRQEIEKVTPPPPVTEGGQERSSL